MKRFPLPDLAGELVEMAEELDDELGISESTEPNEAFLRIPEYLLKKMDYIQEEKLSTEGALRHVKDLLSKLQEVKKPSLCPVLEGELNLEWSNISVQISSNNAEIWDPEPILEFQLPEEMDQLAQKLNELLKSEC